MAADDKGAETDGPSRVAPGATPPAETPPQTEWTASDRRGPLEPADADGVERVVPSHEMDADGAVDPSSPTIEPTAAHDADPRHAEVATADADPAASPRAAEPKRSLVPVAAGLVIGALVGAGSAWLVYANAGATGGDRGQQVAALASRVDALDKRPDPGPRLDKLRDDLAALGNKVAALATRAPDAGAKPAGGGGSGQGSPPSATDGLAAKVAAMQATLAGLQGRASGGTGASAETIASLREALDAARKQAADAQAAVSGVKGEQQQLGAKLATLGGTVSGALAKVEGAQKQAAELRSGLDAVQGRQKTLESKLGSPALAVVADSLVGQIRTGQPFARQVDALAALDADPAKVALLREKAGGVASAQALLGEWKPLESAVIAAGNKASANANLGQRLEHGLMGLVSVRRADDTVGNDLAARVNAIEADLVHGDVAGANAKWQALPQDARARSEAWGGKLAVSAATLGTARDLQRAAIDALGGKKS